ncbi:hypothetical protein Taro_034252 [Colocasia esculenta]|uniref:Uncharacterized protein n=1 Tax=Colocasia esculenta TaxID=4460 RepID=A0A843W084_COLES|nr:hypothetical protein [Colocasia esculenta]
MIVQTKVWRIPDSDRVGFFLIRSDSGGSNRFGSIRLDLARIRPEPLLKGSGRIGRAAHRILPDPMRFGGIGPARSGAPNHGPNKTFLRVWHHLEPPRRSSEPRFKNPGIGIGSVGPKPIRPGDPDPGSAEPGRARLSQGWVDRPIILAEFRPSPLRF